MELKELQRHWDALGRTDPLWAILVEPEKRNGKWDKDQFFAVGQEEIDCVLGHVSSLSFPLRRSRALDFGCGVGRLTQALCRHFDRCDGIDIAPSMIEWARKYNRHGNRCRYAVNDRDDLTLFNDNTFDFIYSSLVLQHMRSEYSKNYIKEFLRVLAPGGLALFQLPSRRLGDDELPYKALIRVGRTSMTARPATRISIPARVKNVSRFTWPEIRLGNRWLIHRGQLLSLDDGRTPLPVGMKPGEETQVSITVTTPRRPGDYLLEFDLVHEHVVWFRAMGSQTAVVRCRVQDTLDAILALLGRLHGRIRASAGYGLGAKVYRRLLRSLQPVPSVRVNADAASNSGGKPAADFEPLVEMHGVPQDEVVSVVQTNGGKIVETAREYSAGKGWESFLYTVTKTLSVTPEVSQQQVHEKRGPKASR